MATQTKKTNPHDIVKPTQLQEERISKILALLAERQDGMYRDELMQALGIPQPTLHYLVKYARTHGWIVCQTKYYINPHNVMVAGGKVIRLQTAEGCVTA